MGCVRVLLADDQPEMLQEISQLLDGEFSIVAAVEDGEQVVEAVQRLDPDLLVLDISMPVLSGLEAAARLKLKESACRAKLVFVTVHQDPDYVEAASRWALSAMCSSPALLSICFQPSGQLWRAAPLSRRQLPR